MTEPARHDAKMANDSVSSLRSSACKCMLVRRCGSCAASLSSTVRSSVTGSLASRDPLGGVHVISRQPRIRHEWRR